MAIVELPMNNVGMMSSTDIHKNHVSATSDHGRETDRTVSLYVEKGGYPTRI